MAGHGDDLGSREGGGAGGDFPFHPAEFGAAENRLCEPVWRDAKVIERRARPFGRVDVDELRGARDRELVFHAAGEKEIEIVREKEAPRGEVGDGRAARPDFLKLKRRVVENIWDARRRVDAVARRARVRNRVYRRQLRVD